MTIYQCKNCGHKNTDVDGIDIADWASYQDPADVCGLPVGTCVKCAAPVYEPGTFAKLDAARAMLAALEAIAGICEADDQYPHHTTQAAKAITQARAAGITPTV